MSTTDRRNCTQSEDGSWHSNLGDDRTLYTREDPDTIDHILQTVLDVMKAGGGVVQICVKLGIHTSTYHEWKKKHSDFKAVCEKGQLLSVDSWDTIGLDGLSNKFFNERLYKQLRTNKHYEHYSEHGRPRVNEFSECKTAQELGDAIVKALSEGRLNPDEALKISQTFCNMASLKERTELETRLVELEKHQEKK